MEFEPVYYGERLRTINPSGDVGVVTLWSPVKVVESKLSEWGVDVGENSSRIAALGNLYGNGLPHLLRNLLWNPQISCLLVIGQNLSGSAEHLSNFFEYGLEEADVLGVTLFKIRGTNRYIDGLVVPEDFSPPPSITVVGKVTHETTRTDVLEFFQNLPAQLPPRVGRSIKDLPKVEVARYPSEPRSHVVVRRRPLEAWQELIFRLVRFGHRNELRKGARIELQNVKVVVQEPIEDPDELMHKFGFDPDHFRDYQERILRADVPEETSYTYGNRLRGYFVRDDKVVDFIDESVRRIKQDNQTRHAFTSLWDSSRDGHNSSPCLVTVFLRVFENKLTLTATFRTHNAMSAWPENVWGLMAIQRQVCRGIQIGPGAITVISHSISIDADATVLSRAQEIARQRVSDDDIDPVTGKRELRLDPNGEFTITVDKAQLEVVAQHSYQGVLLTEYRGKTAWDIELQIARDCAISEVSHAMYVGRELAKAEHQVKGEQNRE